MNSHKISIPRHRNVASHGCGTHIGTFEASLRGIIRSIVSIAPLLRIADDAPGSTRRTGNETERERENTGNSASVCVCVCVCVCVFCLLAFICDKNVNHTRDYQ